MLTLPTLDRLFPSFADIFLPLRLLALVPVAVITMIVLRFTNPWESDEPAEVADRSVG